MANTEIKPSLSLRELARELRDYESLAEFFVTEITSRFECGEIPNFTSLTENCYKAAIPILNACSLCSYNVWLFYVTPTFTGSDVDKVHLGKISTAQILTRYQFELYRTAELTVKSEIGERLFGIHEINWSQVEKALILQSSNVNAMTVLSKQNLSENIEDLNRVSSYPVALGAEKSNTSTINWYALANLLCNRGDLVVKTWGGFDDIEREIQLFYDRRNIEPTILRSLEFGEQSIS